MIEGLNASQSAIAEKTDGLLVVDAGPGTGKTHTIVRRYVEILKKENVSPKDILLMTFTRNAAAEMGERIKSELAKSGMADKSKLVMAKTFDAFCMSIVMDSPELVSSFFKVKHTLTRGARMDENKTMQNQYFNRFLDNFLDEHMGDYGDYGVIASQNPISVKELISKLMSYGIIPLKVGWFGDDPEKILNGDTEKLIEAMNELNAASTKNSPMAGVIDDIGENGFRVPEIVDYRVEDWAITDAAGEDRSELLRFIHDVYYGYITASIRDNRITYGLVATFAFVLLYEYESVRDRNSFRYVMIDEFQDTNANQLMIAMMLMSEPNLCVVGDWKQGIYGFRFVSIDNIIDFENRARELRRFLNDVNTKVRFHIENVETLPLDINYRSSQEIIDESFRCLELPGSKDDEPDLTKVKKATHLIMNPEKPITDTEIRYIQSANSENEAFDVVKTIWDYLTPGKYRILNKDGSTRDPVYGDIAVICPKNVNCRAVMEACTANGIPAFLHGEVSIMSTREGKLALAWMRFVNNEKDERGYVPILADMKYTLNDIKGFVASGNFPQEIMAFRKELRLKRRRITELLTLIFGYYGMDNDITQAIITTISTFHRNSLMTISDVISVMSEDIENDTTYKIDNSLNMAAVSIMTMHKSKGLEFPIVIAPYIDGKTIPQSNPEKEVFLFNELYGLRCTREVGHLEGYAKEYKSWRTALVKKAVKRDYDEDRRLMFVTVSRAKQYLTLMCGKSPSRFIKGLSGESYSPVPSSEPVEASYNVELLERPDISGYESKKTRLGVHDILDFGSTGMSNMSDKMDEIPGKGKEYGTRIHKLAYYMQRGFRVDESEYPELPVIHDILDSLKDAKTQAEVDCSFKVPDTEVVLRGQIDLLAEFPDRVEIHDYKTDVSRDFELEYKIQLSVYAHIAEEVYHKPVECVIDYVSRKETERFEPLPLEAIKERIELVLTQ